MGVLGNIKAKLPVKEHDGTKRQHRRRYTFYAPQIPYKALPDAPLVIKQQEHIVRFHIHVYVPCLVQMGQAIRHVDANGVLHIIRQSHHPLGI